MNTALITITASITILGKFELSVQPHVGRAISRRSAGHDAAGAAAIAVEQAIRVGPPYAIFAPGSVLAHIPVEMRSAK